MKRKQFNENGLTELLTKERKISPPHSLCQEFIEHIFKYLPPTDLYYTIPFVCSFWRNLSHNIKLFLWKKFIPLNLLQCFKEDKYTNYKKLYLSLNNGNLYFKELFLFKLQKLSEKLPDNNDDSKQCFNILSKIENLIKTEKFIFAEKKYLQKVPKKNLQKTTFLEIIDVLNDKELTEKEKQLKFLQSTIIVNPSTPEITKKEDDDYRYPGRFFIDVNFCNEITIIGLNGNCSNKFIYEGNGNAERYHGYEIHDVTVTLSYELNNLQNNCQSTNKMTKDETTDDEIKIIEEEEEEEEEEEKKESKAKLTEELFSCYMSDHKYFDKTVNCKRMKEILEKFREELAFTELSNLDFLNVLDEKLHNYYIVNKEKYVNDCFFETDVLLSITDFEEENKEKNETE
ncbi:hypothetical protein ABK040_011746 [Willaertia magna]